MKPIDSDNFNTNPLAFFFPFPIKCAPSSFVLRSMKLVAGVAQLVEQRIRNAKVGGSIPLTGTMKLTQ